jgi:putative hemolysin
MNTPFTSADLYALLGALVILFFLAAFFSASETALLGFDWLRLRYLARKGNRNARILERILARKDRLIAVILVGSTIANIAASSIATVLAIAIWGDNGIAVATGAMTFLMLVLAEITPKTFASRHVEPFGLAIAPIYSVLGKLLLPLVVLVTALSNGLLRLFGSTAKAFVRPSLSEEEIRTLLAESRDTANVAENKRRMLHGVFQMSNKAVREVMIPRTRILAVDVASEIAEAAQLFIRTGHTRLPVYRETLDDVVGFIHARDVLDLLAGKRQGSIGSVMHEPFFVPETMTLEILLYEIQRRHTHMALVVDEYGGVEGLVTLEDVIEEIVGDIRDEHDLEGQAIRFLPGGEAVVQGHAALHDVNDALKLKLPTDVDVTLGGFVMTRLAHIPEKGETFVHEGVRFTVERIVRHRVLLVRVTPLGENGGE